MNEKEIAAVKSNGTEDVKPNTKVAVITGGHRGLGFGIMKELCAKFDGIVCFTVLEEGMALDTLKELKKFGFSADFHLLDIDNAESISKFAKFIKDTYGGIDVLVNNAGISAVTAPQVPYGEQAEIIIRVNFFGTLAVCRSLYPLLRPHARVSTLSSSYGHLHNINGHEPHAAALRERFASPTLTEDKLCDLMNEFVEKAKEGTWIEAGWAEKAYAVSKVGLSALTRLQQKAFDADPREDLVVNCAHPGFARTHITSHDGPLTVAEAVVVPSYLALLPPNIEKPKGAYIWCDMKEIDWVKGPLPPF